MLTTNTNFDAKHDLDYKTPVYLVHFDGETVDYVTHKVASPNNVIRKWLAGISGASQKITPEQGRSSIGQLTIEILDIGTILEWDTGIEWADGIEWDPTIERQITKLIATDPANLHNKKCTVKGGYLGMAETDMLTIETGWVSGIKLDSKAVSYLITISNPLKWLQREIFRGSEDTPVTFSGNPLNILLSILTSTGNGTNGDYDCFAAVNSLGVDESIINVSHIEEVRDDWFAGVTFSFDIRSRISAKRFIEDEIFAPCNIYPVIKGDGTFDVRVYHPPLPSVTGTTQSFTEDNIIGVPKWDQNLTGMINEAEFHIDHDAAASTYDNIHFFIGDTVDARGAGKKPLTIKSRGITTALGGLDFITRRKTRVFQRYEEPPPKINVDAFFEQYLSEVGDVVPITHTQVPNLVTGNRGVTSRLMEIIDRSVDWKKGKCKFTLLDTSWTGQRFAAISPAGTVVSGASQTVFTLDTDQGAKFEVGWVVSMFRCNMVVVTANLTITDITGDQITVGSNIASTPVAGWIMIFADYDYVTDDQKNYAFIANSSDKVGAEQDDAYLIC